MAWTRTRRRCLQSQAIRLFCSLRLTRTPDGLHGLAERLLLDELSSQPNDLATSSLHPESATPQ